MNRAIAIVAVLGALGCHTNPAIETVGGPKDGQAGGDAAGSPLPPERPPLAGDGGNADAVLDDDASCAATTARAVPVPVDLVIVQDKSGSMDDPATGGVTKWVAVKEALGAFLASPETTGMGAGLTFFPPDDVGQCDIAGYANLVAPIAPLPASAASIIRALNMTAPAGGTPTQPALEGALQYAQQWERDNTRRVALILATDGSPNNCDSSVQSVSMIATRAAGRGIRTFVLGVGPLLDNLNSIAAAGNTGAAYLVETVSTADLVAAFQAIRMQAVRLACTFALPPAPGGRTLDPDRVNVRFGAAPGPSTLLRRASSAAQCGPMGGWFYDDPVAPTKITLCDASCSMANSTVNAELSLVFGCKTELIP